MGNVIGPITYGDWMYLRMLNTSANLLTSWNKDGRFTKAITKERELYHERLRPYK